MTIRAQNPLIADLFERHRARLELIPEVGEIQACVYLRISQDREGDELGIDRHFEDLLGLIKARGWALNRRHVFVDNDVSGAGKARSDFDRMLAVVETGAVKVLTAWMLDRLLRNRPDQVRLYELAEEKSLLMCFARGTDIDMSTASGQMVADILGGIARGEIKLKGERHHRAQKQAAEQGRRVGGRRRFGYEVDGMTIRDAEAKAIRAAYRDLPLGVPLAEIARSWNDAGLFSGQANSRTWAGKPRTAPVRWSHDTVRLVLLNPAYKAIRAHRGVEITQAVWPRLVEDEVWQLAFDVLKDPSRAHGARADQQLLTGAAICGTEGCGMGVHGGGATHGKPVYRCKSMKHFNRLAEPCDLFVGDVVVARLARADAADLLVDESRVDLDALRTELAAKRARLDALAIEFADDDTLTPKQLRLATERLRARITEIQSTMADAVQVDVLGDLVNAEPEEPDEEKTESVRRVWERMGNGRRRAVINALMIVELHPVGRGTRTFRPETVTISWKRKAES